MDIVQRNFAGGEVAPGLYGRQDTTKVQTGARTIRNMFVRRHGGASNRPGTQYICSQKTHSQRGRILKFVFNADQTYVLLFEHMGMRVIQNGVLLTVPGALAWNAGTNYVAGDVASRLGVNYYCYAAHINQQPPNATWWYPMPADDIYEMPTAFDAADLQGLYRSQSGDIVTITHTTYRIYDLSRTGHTTWVMTIANMIPSIAAPASITVSGVAGTVNQWVATAVKNETYEESEPCSAAGSNTAASSGSPRTLTIATVSDALEYNVYKNEGAGIYGFIGVSKSGTFVDKGHVPDYDVTPPAPRDPFSTSGDYPAVSGYLQQRKAYGGSLNNPETAYLSKTGQYKNFGISSPLRLNDASTYPIASTQVNEIRHLIEVQETFILTSQVEWVALGGTDGALTPGSPGLKPKSYYGSSKVPPIIIGENLLFIQELGGLVRDMNYDASTTGYKGRDLSVFAPHLFAGKTIEHWDFAQIPDSLVLAQQNDGGIIGLTYLPEHEVWGWFHYDTDGWFEDVVSIPEGGEHAFYVLVRRTINGQDQRYLERFYHRDVKNNGLNNGSVALDARFLDSHLTYDGRLSGDTMTLSGGSTWDYPEDLTLTYAGTSFFVAGDVGNAIRLELYETTYGAEDGHEENVETLMLDIVAYVDPETVTVRSGKTVPAAFRNVGVADYARAVDTLSGLDHLEGKSVAILADGQVLTNGIDAPLTIVTGGSITLDAPYCVIHVGLPYCSDLETLDLEIDGGEPLAAKKKRVDSVTLHVEASRGLWIGEGPERPGDTLYLTEWKQRRAVDGYGAVPLFTGKFRQSIKSRWNTGGRVFIRQRDPLPLTCLNVIPNVTIGG